MVIITLTMVAVDIYNQINMNHSILSVLQIE